MYNRLVRNLSRYEITTNGCHEWTGNIAPNGYGRVHLNGTRFWAHRTMWEVCNGVELKTDNVIMHSCDNPKCVNPAHLQLGTFSTNFLDMWAKGRTVIVSGERHGRTSARRNAILV